MAGGNPPAKVLKGVTMKKIFIVLLLFLIIFSFGAEGKELGNIYLNTKSEYSDIVEKLYEGGATEGDILIFFEDVENELILNCADLNEENFDDEMEEAIITALKYSRNVAVYNALMSKFSMEAVYFLKHNEIPETLSPLYTKMKEEILANEEIMFKISAMFSDQREFSWAMPAIESLVESGIIKGYPDKTFKGNAHITRAEFTKMVVMAFVGNNTESICSFDDVTENDWFYPYISTATENKIVKGFGENIFAPNQNITRQDMAVIINNTIKKHGNGDIGFSDAEEISDYAKGAVVALTKLGVISGMGNGTFAPKENATRAQAAMMIYNAMGK